MQTKIHIVEFIDSDGKPDGTRRIIESHKLKNNHISVKHYDDYDDCYYTELQKVRVLHTFIVVTRGRFIINDSDSSKLNAYRAYAGLGNVSRLSYTWSAHIVNYKEGGEMWDTDLIWSDSGIRSTRFDMYSYHVNEPEQRYLKDRLDYEVWDSLDLNKILAKYLTLSDIRNNKIEELGL
jgi:hypothetical protein